MKVQEKGRLDRSRLAAPQVFDQLREAIVTLTMAPGTVLARDALALQFGISQTPVRDALMRLGEEGLVDIFPQHATVVSKINITSAKQAHFLRMSIELEVVGTLASRPNALLTVQLRTLIAAQVAVMGVENYSAFVVADHAFHQHMYTSAGVPDLWALVRRNAGHADRLRRLHLPAEGKAQAVVRDHGCIVDAIERGDADAARQALRTHLSGTLGTLDEICARYPAYIAD
jgi:DNA-binding GntR family transcriptional regulator